VSRQSTNSCVQNTLDSLSFFFEREKERATFWIDVTIIQVLSCNKNSWSLEEFYSILNRPMGAFISLMYVIVEELADISVQMRLDLDSLKDEKEKEALVLKQIRLYANNGAKAYAFPKGTGCLIWKEFLAFFFCIPLCKNSQLEINYLLAKEKWLTIIANKFYFANS